MIDRSPQIARWSWTVTPVVKLYIFRCDNPALSGKLSSAKPICEIESYQYMRDSREIFVMPIDIGHATVWALEAPMQNCIHRGRLSGVSHLGRLESVAMPSYQSYPLLNYTHQSPSSRDSRVCTMLLLVSRLEVEGDGRRKFNSPGKR